MTINRRHFLVFTGTVVGAELVAAAAGGSEKAAKLIPSATGAGGTSGVASGVGRAAVDRMQEDLARALEKPAEKRSWAMAVDVRKCIGCRACVIACKAEHVSPPGVSYRRVSEVEDGEYPDVKRYFMPANCMQCADPPCMAAAPAGAITKRPGGIVVFHADKLRGEDLHKKLVAACPYNVLSFDDGAYYTGPPLERQPYETVPSRDYGVTSERPKGTTRKCDFCLHRIESGVLPACVTTCIGHAMYFGDLNDSSSVTARIVASETTVQLYEPEKQKPRIFHIAQDKETCAKCH